MPRAASTPPPGQHMRTQANTEHDGSIRELDDPEFFTQWSLTRQRLVETPKGKPEHCELKRRYDALLDEYRRRTYGE
jgi:hypothetical protein